jgi:hypothetical protein
VGLPLYVVVAVTVVGWFDRPPIWAELLLYVVLGVIWALPFRAVFLGVGRPDPDAPPEPADTAAGAPGGPAPRAAPTERGDAPAASSRPPSPPT